MLMERLLQAIRARKIQEVTLEVRASDLDAQRFYRGFGFEAAGLRRNYYADSGEDAVIMHLDLRPSGEQGGP